MGNPAFQPFYYSQPGGSQQSSHEKSQQSAQEKSNVRIAYEQIVGAFNAYFIPQGAFNKFMGTKSGGYIQSIAISERAHKVSEQRPILFEDNKLYIHPSFFEKNMRPPSAFSPAFFTDSFSQYCNFMPQIIGAIKEGLAKAGRLNQDSEQFLVGLRATFSSSLLSLTPFKNQPEYRQLTPAKESDFTTLPSKTSIPEEMLRLYRSLSYYRGAPRLSPEAFAHAYQAYKHGVQSGSIKEGRFIIADFNQRDSEPRLYLANFEKMEIISAIRFTHGSRSDIYRDGWADVVSNEIGSHKSSEGLYAFLTYYSNAEYNGITWRLEGMYSTNSNSIPRGILMHRARSKSTWGCFGINPIEALSIGLPIANNIPSFGNNAKNALESWVGTGIYAYYDPKVQIEHKKEYNQMLKSKEPLRSKLIQISNSKEATPQMQSALADLSSQENIRSLLLGSIIQIPFHSDISFADRRILREIENSGFNITTSAIPIGKNEYMLIFKKRQN